MSYNYEQKINGKIYVYEVESYWDKEKKQPRQKRTYLGRKDEKTGEIRTRRKPVPIGSYSVGSVHLLKGICKQSNLLKVLKRVFPNEFEKILYLSFFKVVKGEPYYFYNSWCEEAYVSLENRMSSIDVSEFLSNLGQDEISIETFFKEWIKEFTESRAVMFDITSISSYGTRNEFLERGYNRDGENLDQVNLGMIAQAPLKNKVGLPIAYRIYPGSITDVTTLNNIIDLIKKYSLHLQVLVMDKEFYSQENIKSMHLKDLKYIMPMSFSTKLSKEILNKLNEDLQSPKSSFAFHEQVYSHCHIKIELGGKTCDAHVYLDKKRRAEQESRFIKKISDVEKFFSQKKFSNKDEATVYLQETLKSKKKYFVIDQKDEKFVISRDIKIFEEEILKMGTIILLTNNELFNKDEILDLYRRKDCVEKVFMSFKHDVNEKRSRTHSLMAMRGSIFINFISLVLITWIDHVMKEKQLYKKITKGEMYKMLDRLKLYELATNETMLGEMSKKQKDIFSAFKISKKLKPSTARLKSFDIFTQRVCH